MSAGAALPMDAGLPVTEAVRTGRTVVQGRGPSWVALPFRSATRGEGALLISLVGPPTDAPEELARLQHLAAAVGSALRRVDEQSRAAIELHAVTANLSLPEPALAGWELVVRSQPRAGAVLGGDVVLAVPDARGGSWLVVADVCGSGLPAAALARAVHATFTTLAPHVGSSAAMLAAADASLRGVVGAGSFVTAVVVHATGARLDVATAGHPAPLLLTPAGAHALEVEPGPPLALESGHGARGTAATAELPPDGVLLLYTDGLLDRRSPGGAVGADALSLVAGRVVHDLDRLADELLVAAQEVGAAGDDVTLLLARPAH